MNIAVAHKDYDVRGGGEILAETLAHGLDAPLIVGHDDMQNRDEAMGEVETRELAPHSHWHKLASIGGPPRSIAHMMLWRDHADNQLQEYDTVITSGNEPLWWLPREDQTVIAYTHSTPRWMYDLYNKQKGFFQRSLTQFERWVYTQDFDIGIDLWIANSDIVARRIRSYWGIDDVRVIYPPIDIESLRPTYEQTSDYYLSLGRLDSLKRVDWAVSAADELGFDLKIAGTGSAESELRDMAPENVELLGWVDQDEKRRLLSGARATINCAMNEDFGMIVLESLASGTPVITIDEGMPKYIVEDGVRGIQFSAGGLVNAIERYEQEGVTLSEVELASWAESNFGQQRFIRQMQLAIEDAEKKNMINPEFNS